MTWLQATTRVSESWPASPWWASWLCSERSTKTTKKDGEWQRDLVSSLGLLVSACMTMSLLLLSPMIYYCGVGGSVSAVGIEGGGREEGERVQMLHFY